MSNWRTIADRLKAFQFLEHHDGETFAFNFLARQARISDGTRAITARCAVGE